MQENPQCKTCSLPTESQNILLNLVEKKATNQDIANTLSLMYDTFISEAAIRRHIKNHMKVDRSKMESDPKEKEEVSINEDGTGHVQTRAYRSPVDITLISNVAQMLENAGVDPQAFDVVGDIGVRSWDSAAFDREANDFVTVRLHSYRIKIQSKKSAESKVNLPLLYAQAKTAVHPLKAPDPKTDRTLCAVFADPQIGKSGSRGGTSDLMHRVESIRAQLGQIVDDSDASQAVFMDGGDIIEGFENVAAQMHTNDLSLMEQLDLALTMEFDMIRTLADGNDIRKVDVMGVPSNHTGWRKFKDYLGKPSDDYGLFLLKQIQKVFGMSEVYDHMIDYHFPNEWEESLNLDVQGYGLGLVHGHQANRPEAIPTWWTGQSHGRQAVSESDILVTGHFHHFRMMPTGRNKFGKSRWWMQAPTLDNGSDWFRNRTGEDSDPGLLVFEVEPKKGLDISSIQIISAD